MQFPVAYRTRFQEEDMINQMPENVITNILDRLPIEEAVRTSILSRNWRFTWTLLSQLVFNDKFIRYLASKKHVRLFYKKNLSKVLLQLKGSITKFVLYIPYEDHKRKKEYDEMYGDIVEDINHWILFLSTKGLQKFSLKNMRDEQPLKLPNHLFSCLELKHLKLYNCCLHPVQAGFHFFPKLLRFDFQEVEFESCKYGEFITMCPLLEYLNIDDDSTHGEEVKLGEIAKLVNLKVLSLKLDMLGDKVVTSSDILQLMASLPKLEMLTLDFTESYTVLAKAGSSINGFSGNLHRLMKLELEEIDYEDDIMVECACDLINGLPNLQTLKMIHVEGVLRVPVDDVSKVVCSIKGNLQLQYVEFEFLGSKIEERFIESLLACSPLLKKMVIKGPCDDNYYDSCCSFSRKLLKFHRASPIAEIHLD